MYNSISIILAVYNGQKYLNQLLDSILSQINVNISEIIVIDDCSTDKSEEIIRSFQKVSDKIIYYKNATNIGPILTFKLGAKIATSNYIAFADQDDIWLDNKLSLSLQLIKEIDTLNKPSVVFTNLKMINERSEVVYNSFWEVHNIEPATNNFFTLLFGNIITGCSMLINKRMLNEFINMPIGVIMHDHWIALIASSFGALNYSYDTPILYRVHNESVTNKSEIKIKHVIKEFFKASFSKKSNFLENNLKQATLFKSKYYAKLNEQNAAQLKYFISLKHSAGISRKFHSRFRFVVSKWI